MDKSPLLADFEKFKGEPSVQNRVSLTGKICRQFGDGYFKSSEKEIIKEILDFLSRDLEKAVRKILAETLKENDELPHDVALRLANDIEEISTPILEFSTVLTDIDLEIIISSAEEIGKLAAIAKRHDLSEKISECLINTEKESVVKVLLDNKTANISSESCEKITETFKQSETILGALIHRGGIDINLAEKMLSIVSGKLHEQLTNKYKLTPKLAKQSVQSSQEKATLDVISQNVDRTGAVELTNHLYNKGELSHSLVFRALCQADLDFFEAGIARLAGISLYNASKLIHHGDSRGFSALFQAASIPSTMLEATEVLLRIIMSDEKNTHSSPTYSKYLIERIIEGGYDQNVPNMKYFLALIKSCSSDTHTPLH